ncbi:dCTP deaminase domain-containing protein [Yoonia sp. 208BN28-4]|uniref:dCTP deaminase domain-containing protein n=1 Tax=Yoonia sp. 208BN28-4 TaxID=3126505 RepID=UPI0030B27485
MTVRGRLFSARKDAESGTPVALFSVSLGDQIFRPDRLSSNLSNEDPIMGRISTFDLIIIVNCELAVQLRISKLIIGQEILERKLVQPCEPHNLKNSTCDLTIGQFYPMGQNRSKGASPSQNDYWVEPGAMVAVRTLERVALPSSVTGLATLVTSLTHEGLLCLNVGVIDPGYDGHLSAFLVNFSRRPRKLSLNDRLFRVLFFEHGEVSELLPLENTKEEYHRFLLGKSENEFATTFLDVAGITKLAEQTAWKIVLNAFFSKWVAPLSLLIALASMIFAALTYFG